MTVTHTFRKCLEYDVADVRALFEDAVAGAHWLYLVRIGAITPRRARSYTPPLVVIADASKDGRGNPVVLRRLRATIAAAGAKPGKGAKKNLQLLYDLAVWQCRRKGADIPKRGLAKHMDDRLWAILQNNREVCPCCPSFAHMPKAKRDKLEKRLHHQWKDVKQIADALKAPMRRASNSRRKPKKSFVDVLLQPSPRANP